MESKWVVWWLERLSRWRALDRKTVICLIRANSLSEECSQQNPLSARQCWRRWGQMRHRVGSPASDCLPMPFSRVWVGATAWGWRSVLIPPVLISWFKPHLSRFFHPQRKVRGTKELLKKFLQGQLWGGEHGSGTQPCTVDTVELALGLQWSPYLPCRAISRTVLNRHVSEEAPHTGTHTLLSLVANNSEGLLGFFLENVFKLEGGKWCLSF